MEHGPGETIPPVNSFTTDTASADAMARALWRVQHRREPVCWPNYGTLVISALVTAHLVGHPGVALFVAVVGVPLVAFGMLHGIRRQIRRTFPAGTTLATGFGASALTLHTPVSTARLCYTAFRRVDESGGFVALRHRDARLFTVLPRVLVPDPDLAHLRARVPG